MRRWLARALHDAEKEESKSLIARLTEGLPSRRAAASPGTAPVLPSRAVSIASDGCVVIPPAMPTHRRVWFERLPIRARFDGGVVTCCRAVVYHLLLGLCFEAAVGAIEPLDFTSDL